MVEAAHEPDGLSDEVLASLDDPPDTTETDVEALAPEAEEAKKDVADVVDTLSGLLHLEETIQGLQTSNAAAMQTILEVLRGEFGPLRDRITALEQKLTVIFAILEMPPETMSWLLSLAAQSNVSLGTAIAHVIEPQVSWDPADFMFVVKGDLARAFQEAGIGRFAPEAGDALTAMDKVRYGQMAVEAALQFAYDQRNL